MQVALLPRVRFMLTLLVLIAGAGAASAQPASPNPVSPADGASVTIPFDITWTETLDPANLNGGYNYQVSPSLAFTPLVFTDSTMPGDPNDTVSGLPAGTYFWRVQAVDGAARFSAWSQPRRVVVTGVGPGTPGTPVMNPTRGYSTFHPWEFIYFSWSDVPGAVTYRLEVSDVPTFPLDGSGSGFPLIFNTNIPDEHDGFVWHPSLGEGRFFARVIATDADHSDGVRGLPSNVIDFTVFFNNPIGPPPVLTSPIAGETLTLPIPLDWAHVPNPQSGGYTIEVATDSGFRNVETFFTQYTDNRAVITSLSGGQKFWRALSSHGLSSPETFDQPGTVANTAWSATGTFRVSTAPARVASIEMGHTPVYSGAETPLRLQLTAVAPAGGATVSLSSSAPGAFALPATMRLDAGFAYGEMYNLPAGQVTVPTPVRLTATYAGSSAFTDIVVMPPTLNDDTLQSGGFRATGGAQMVGWVDLEGFGVSPPGGFVVDLATDSPFATVPSTVTIPGGWRSMSFFIDTSPVTSVTPVRISASHGGVTVGWTITLTPSPVPTSFNVRPMSTTSGSQGVVTAASGAAQDQLLAVSSSNTAVASVPSLVNVFAGSGVGYFDIQTSPVTAATPVTISVSGGGATINRTLVVYPTLPALLSLTVAPSVVDGGQPATGTVTISAGAPAGGLAIGLENSLPSAASVPHHVIVPAGARSVTFPITTFPVDTTTVVFSASLDRTWADGSILVRQPPPTPALSAISISPSSVVGGTSATGTATLSAPAPSGGAVVSLSDDSSATGVPASVTILAGATSRTFTVTTSAVANATTSTVSGSYGGNTRSATLGVNPGPPGTPSLVSPANDARPAQPVALDWSDASGAASYIVEIDDGSTFSAPLVLSQSVTGASQVTVTGLPARRLFWRVRGVNGAGVTGSWSAVRRFTPGSPPNTSLSSVAASPARFVGGAASQGTATLTAGAPSGGALVSLSSANPSVAAVPATVMVPQGASSAPFNVTSASVAVSTPVTITGTWGGTTRTTTITVDPTPPPASLSSITLAPATVAGGSTSQGTATLTSAAPAGGAVVTLSSSATAVATVPASVTVPAGALSAPFTVSTSVVSSTSTASITGQSGGATRSATLTVTSGGGSGPLPAPALVAPANDARFAPGANAAFDWTDVTGAASYTIQIDDTETFSGAITREASVTASAYATTTLPTIRVWWRVRANNASGEPGAWSAVRRMEIKQ